MAAPTNIQQTRIRRTLLAANKEIKRLNNNPAETASGRAFQEAEKHEQAVKVLKEPLQPAVENPVIGIPVDFVLKKYANAHRYVGKVLQFFGFDEAEPGINDFTSGQQERDPVTGSQLGMFNGVYQVAEVRVNYTVDLMMSPEDFSYFDAGDVGNIELLNHNNFNSLSTSDLPINQGANAMTDLLPAATDPLA